MSKPIFILDPHLEIPLPRRILTDNPNVTLIHDDQVPFAKQQRLQAQAVQLVAVPSQSPDCLDLQAVLAVLGQRGVHDVWVEAGGTLLMQLLQANLVQRAVFYVAAKTLGDMAQPAFTQALNLAQQARSVQWQALGKDGMCTIEWEVTDV
ncbi:MAG: hypothetical protein GKR77_02825 [Legionellales bacterium]|nr:hypothetical protein [Legionellales bacterium]